VINPITLQVATEQKFQEHKKSDYCKISFHCISIFLKGTVAQKGQGEGGKKN